MKRIYNHKICKLIEILTIFCIEDKQNSTKLVIYLKKKKKKKQYPITIVKGKCKRISSRLELSLSIPIHIYIEALKRESSLGVFV
jgi:hypothetical protein